MGAKSSVIPIYGGLLTPQTTTQLSTHIHLASEVSTARLRGAVFTLICFPFPFIVPQSAELIRAGRMLTSWQNGTAFGIAASGAIALLVPNGWRFQIASSFIPAFALLLLVFVGSESPRWLIKKQRYTEAYIVLLRLRENALLASRDLVLIWAQLQVETTLFTRTEEDVIDLENRVPYLDSPVYLREIGLFGYGRRITQLFTIPRARRATVASALVMLAQQLTGVNVFAFFASTLFGYGNKGSSADLSNLWLYFAFGVTNFLEALSVPPPLSLANNFIRASLLAYRYIDSKGRRWLLMFSLAAMFPLLLATAFSFNTQYHKGPVAVFLVLYTIVSPP